MTSEENFGQLRSLLNASTWQEVQRRVFVQLVRTQVKQDEQVYRDQWVPYISGFARHFEQPLRSAYGLKQLKKCANIHPYAQFDFILDHINAKESKLHVLLSSGLINRVQVLNMDDQKCKDEVLVELAQAAPFERLRELRLRGNAFGDDARAELFNSDLLCGVQALELGQNSLDAEAMCVLAGSTKIKHLQRLGLEHNPLGDEGASALASAEHLGALKHLNVASCKIERDGARALSKARFFGQLESLAFGSSMQQAEGILVNKLGPNIRNLELQNSLVSGKTIERLTRRKDTPTLETLCLKHCNLYPDDFEKIAASAYLKRLRKIDMRLCYGAGEYVPAMLRSMPQLSELDLFNCQVNVDELDAMLSCPEFHQMRSLDLAFNGFGDQGALLIANAPLTANLTSLLLYDRSITELGWSALIDSPYLAESIKKKFQAMKRRHT